MAYQRVPGCNNQWLGDPPPIVIAPTFASVLLDAAADRVTMVGRFAHESQATKTVDGVEFLFGAVTKTNGSTFQVSLQNVDLATGPVIREDGTADQTLSIANADAGFVSNAWYGGDFDGAATRSLAIGELVAVVFQFTSFVAGDSVNLRGLSVVSSALLDNQNAVVANLTGTYALQTLLANVVLRCSDGTFGTLEHAWPCSVINTHTFNVNTAGADEYALGVQLPFPYRTDKVWLPAALAGATNTTEYLVYSGTTALQTVTLDHNALLTATGFRTSASYPEQDHAKDTLYRLAARPTGTTSMNVYSLDVNEVGHMACLPGGANFHTWTRVDQGAWGGEVTTRRLLAGIRVSAFDDAVGGGSGGGMRLAGHGGLAA